jgi:hypothetical protein
MARGGDPHFLCDVVAAAELMVLAARCSCKTARKDFTRSRGEPGEPRSKFSQFLCVSA